MHTSISDAAIFRPRSRPAHHAGDEPPSAKDRCEAHAADEQLDAAHLATADAIAEGNWVRAGRRARFVARREARAITASLG